MLLDATREIRRVADDLEKAYHLPGKLGADIARREELAFEKWLRENQFKSGGAAIIGLLFPAVRAAQTAGIRQEYLLNRLMTIEALRMHAAHHDGELPQALDKLAPVPAFPNPFSGQLFDYSLDNSGGVQTVTLVGEVPESAIAHEEDRAAIRVIRVNSRLAWAVAPTPSESSTEYHLFAFQATFRWESIMRFALFALCVWLARPLIAQDLGEHNAIAAYPGFSNGTGRLAGSESR